MPPSKVSRGGPAAVKKGIAGKVPSGGGKGKTILGGAKRHREIMKDTIRGVASVIKDCVLYMESRNAKTITIHDVLHSLRRIGRPIYGFDPETFVEHKSRKAAGPANH
ncbi:histone H4 [Colletotrichum plurivorum]|uniref:Histone H4 n=1 Tax=Colletotrichum plurivorum TaxID=2175906 RepID=A0A8H6KQ95_9PEZI|nr:histone H4 [Colletotrichum plurivorum]